VSSAPFDHTVSSPQHRRAVRALGAILAVAIVVSIVHYTDNYVNLQDYPQATTAPNPSAGLILAAWFGFTAAGVAGYLLFRRSPSALALALLAVYAGSGLIGIGHFVVPGASSMPWWRQAHVSLDIASGIAMLSFAVWAARARRPSRAAAS
jgi:peptidoglycan/LPS O-acetylase OafA/YrhL